MFLCSLYQVLNPYQLAEKLFADNQLLDKFYKKHQLVFPIFYFVNPFLQSKSILLHIVNHNQAQ